MLYIDIHLLIRTLVCIHSSHRVAGKLLCQEIYTRAFTFETIMAVAEAVCTRVSLDSVVCPQAPANVVDIPIIEHICCETTYRRVGVI